MSVKNECPNCGYDWSNSEKFCKYCGSANPHFVEPKKDIFSLSSITSSSDDDTKKSLDKNFNIGIFILLLFVCAPAAIVYLLVMSKSIK